jgi:hypothetical protein
MTSIKDVEGGKSSKNRPAVSGRSSERLHSRFPGLDLFSHDAGHLRYTVLGFEGDPHGNPAHFLSNILILTGFVILYMAWKVLYSARRKRRLATTGPYARIRHPQYAGFILILRGERGVAGQGSG